MSTGRRAYDLLRGYINREWERIQDVYETSAEQELNDAIDRPMARPPRTADAQYDEQEYEVVILSQEEKARQILGVAPGATFEEIRKAFDRLNDRSNPDNFPAGSPEAEQAAEIRSRVYRAYRILCDKFDPTETRFKSLEIE
jgi:hypothetical protein